MLNRRVRAVRHTLTVRSLRLLGAYVIARVLSICRLVLLMAHLPFVNVPLKDTIPRKMGRIQVQAGGLEPEAMPDYSVSLPP